MKKCNFHPQKCHSEPFRYSYRHLFLKLFTENVWHRHMMRRKNTITCCWEKIALDWQKPAKNSDLMNEEWMKNEWNKKLMKNLISTVQSGASCTSATAGGDAEAETLKRRDDSEPVRSLVFGVYISQRHTLSHTMITCPRAPRSSR